MAHVIFRHVVMAIGLAGIADTDGHAEIPQPHILATRHVAAQRLDCHHRLAAPLDLEFGHRIGIGTVAAIEMDEVHVGQFAGVVQRAPGAGDGLQMCRDQPVLDGLSERLLEEGREHVVLLA